MLYKSIDPKYVYFLTSATRIGLLTHVQGCREILQERRDAWKLNNKCIYDNMNEYLRGVLPGC